METHFVNNLGKVQQRSHMRPEGHFQGTQQTACVCWWSKHHPKGWIPSPTPPGKKMGREHMGQWGSRGHLSVNLCHSLWQQGNVAGQGALYPAKGRRRARPSIWGGHHSETHCSAVAGSKSGFLGGCTQWPPLAAFLGQPQGKLSQQLLPWHCKEKGCSYVEEGEGQYCWGRERRPWVQARSILVEERQSVQVISGIKQ